MENLQIHFLSSYPPSNPNRNDLGRPKTAIMGGVERLRISSQCLKRAWRTSDVFWDSISPDQQSKRTKRIGRAVRECLEHGYSLEDYMWEERQDSVRPEVETDRADEVAEKIAEIFGDPEGDDHRLSTVKMITPEEIRRIDGLLERVSNGDDLEDDDLELLVDHSRAIDANLFGRMVADNPEFNITGCMQVAHAVTTHGITVETDYFTAVDELNVAGETGSGHIGGRDFSSGIFYGYGCVNLTKLREQLQQGDEKNGGDELYPRALGAFVESMLTVTPDGFKNSFASSGPAEFAVVEHGSGQPRNLASSAYSDPVQDGSYLSESVKRLKHTLGNFDNTYGEPENRKYLDVKSDSSDGDEYVDNLEELRTHVGNWTKDSLS